MSKLQITELQATNTELNQLNDLQTAGVVGGGYGGGGININVNPQINVNTNVQNAIALGGGVAKNINYSDLFNKSGSSQS